MAQITIQYSVTNYSFVNCSADAIRSGHSSCNGPIVVQKMTNTKKILITTDSFERYLITVRSGNHAIGRCSTCRQKVELMNVDMAVSVAGLRTNEIIRRIETNEIHAIETDSGHLLICARSVRELTQKRLEKDNGNT